MTQLITEGYRAQQQAMHEAARGYGGVHSKNYAQSVLDLIAKHEVKDVLDYGAGKGHFGEILFASGYMGDYHAYDPGIPYWAETPQPAEFVACIDVLEHIEPELLDNVLADLHRVTLTRGFFSVHLTEAKKFLPDGRNAHLIIRPPEWWLAKIGERFHIDRHSYAHKPKEPDVIRGLLMEVRPR